jgi:hypothetical protein
MRATKKLTLLCAKKNTVIDWDMLEFRSEVLRIASYRLILGAIHAALEGTCREIERIVIDQAVTAEIFLDMLTQIPSGFRGDILFIDSASKAYLSSSTHHDQRVLYRLGEGDLPFFLRVVFGEDAEANFRTERAQDTQFDDRMEHHLLMAVESIAN